MITVEDVRGACLALAARAGELAQDERLGRALCGLASQYAGTVGRPAPGLGLDAAAIYQRRRAAILAVQAARCVGGGGR